MGFSRAVPTACVAKKRELTFGAKSNLFFPRDPPGRAGVLSAIQKNHEKTSY